MSINNYNQLTSQTAGFSIEDRSICNKNLAVHQKNLTSLEKDISGVTALVTSSVESIKQLINNDVITNHLSLIKEELGTINEDKLIQVTNSLSQIDVRINNIDQSLIRLDEKFSDIEARIDQKLEQATQDLTVTLTSSYNDYLEKYKELINTNVVELKATIEIYINNMNRLMLQTIDACNLVTEKFTQYIIELGVKSDTYLTAIDGFSTAAQTTSEVTSRLSESVVNLQSAITQIGSKVGQLEAGLVNLTNLSMTFNKTLERKLKAVDVADIIEDATTSLLNIKNTFKKDKGDL